MQKEVKILSDHQYAAFAANVKTLDRLRQNDDVNYCPGAFKVEKIIVLTKGDFEKLSEDISPEYPFIRDNKELMSADPGGWFHCLLVTTENEQESLLVAKGERHLYLCYVKDHRKLNLSDDIPVNYLPLENPKVYQEQALFYHRARRLNDLTRENEEYNAPERQTAFRVEKIIVLPDEQFRQFKENGLMDDQIFLFDNTDKMWFDPGTLCWHCLLVKGENSKDGVLIDAEGYAHARYAAFAPDCDRLRLQDVPVHYEYPAKPPKQRSSPKQRNSEPDR